MRHHLHGTAWTALALATIGSAIPLASARAQAHLPEQSRPQEEGAASPDEIVVTARKRNERLQDAPLSVNAVSAAELRQGNARDFKDVLRKVPGVSFSGAELGQSRYSIRGVSTTSPSPTVGIYLDDISLLGATNAFSGAADPVFFDFGRVEILKGPQGTLYGGSAMGGAIKYVSRAPEPGNTTLDTAAGISSTAHGGISYQGEAVLNLPLSDKLVLRTGALYRDNAGFIDNVANGAAVDVRTSTTAPPAALTPLVRPSLSMLADRNQNSDHVLAVKAALLWQPDPSLDITPALFRQAYRQKNSGVFWTNLPDLQSSFRLAQPTDDDLGVYSLNMVKHLGEVDITSLTAYVDRSVRFDRDYSFYIATLVPALYGVNSPNASNSSTRTFSQELRAASANPAARLRWTAGLYYARQRDELDQTVNSIGVGALLGTGTDKVYHGNTVSKLTQFAAFADLTFEILPGLDATAALRYFNLRQTIDTRGDGVLNGGDTHGAASTRESGVNPKFGLAYRASRDNLIYASAAKGFRPGGGNPFAVAPGQCQADLANLGLSAVPVSFRSDSLWTYEVGSKNQFLGRRLTLNGAAFYTDWKNIQQNVFLPGCGFSFSGNVGGAEIKGAELAAQFATGGLTLGAAASYTDAKISRSAPGVSAKVGQPVLDTPKWIANANMAYRVALGGGVSATARADYQYRSSSLRGFEDSFMVNTPAGPVAANNFTRRQRAYDLVNLGLLIDTGAWQVDLFVNNLLDKAPLLDHNVVSGIEAAITLRPRTIGMSVRRQFQVRRRLLLKRAALLALAGCGAIVLLGLLRLGPVATVIATFGSPSRPFDAAQVPPEPDYAKADAWLAFPGRNGLERSTPPGMAAVEEGAAPADVFFIHPTTYQQSDVWNVAYTVPSEFDPAVLLGQASAFNGCCRIFAPHYRQASLRALEKSRPAVALAYADVARAFRHFIAHENHGRPFLIAAHSQGAMHAVRLLQAEILGTPLQARLVAAYVIGAYAPSDFGAIGLPVCDDARQTGCILSWNTSQKGRTGAFRLVRDQTYWWRGREKDKGQPPAICVNPLTWRREGAAPAVANPGSLPFPTERAGAPGRTLAALTPHLTGAACAAGLLDVDIPWSAPRGFQDVLSVLFGSYHLGDYGIFYAAIRRNAAERVDAWRAAHPDRVAGSQARRAGRRVSRGRPVLAGLWAAEPKLLSTAIADGATLPMLPRPSPSPQMRGSAISETMMTATHSTRMLILGSGPAGLTAAIYGARAGLSPIVVQGIQPGGQLMTTTDVENYPGFRDVIQGPWLMQEMQAQAEHVGAQMMWDTIVEVDVSQRPFRMVGDSGTVYLGDVLVIATGAQAKWLGLDSERLLQGKGVSACATCDGFFFRGKKVAVIGGGNTAVEEALYLTNHSHDVTVIHRRDSFRAEKILQQRLFANERISVLWNKKVERFIAGGQPEGLVGIELKDMETGELSQIEVDGGFVAIGHHPATELFRGHIDLDDDGYIRVETGTTKTSVPGVFACGDVMDKHYRQAVTAAGTGCMAALDAERFLAEADFETVVQHAAE